MRRAGRTIVKGWAGGRASARAGALVAAGVWLGACEHEGDAEARAPARTGGGAAVNSWQATETDWVVGVADAGLRAELDAASEQARSTAEQARVKWASQPSQRERWAVKWNAETEDGSVELLWVVPVSWSTFRVEGRLASAPVRPLACGKVKGEIVSFPAGELADWVYLVEGKADGAREGGLTLGVLEAHAGKPR